MAESPPRPPTAALLEELRGRRRLSKQRLAELADVSATYVRNIEAGFDDSGRPVVPSANVIQKLARGLARAEPEESRRAEAERQAYTALMAAAGYLPPAAVETGHESASVNGATERIITPAPAPPSDMPARQPSEPTDRRVPLGAAGRPTDAQSVVVALGDPRLLRHLRALLEDWEALASEDQALIVGIAEFVAERRRRRESVPEDDCK
jgi:transcriptional regulator with XRE-family HTH domain